MRIQAEIDDAPEFVAKVEAVVNGILRHHAPAQLILIKIDNWFGVRWLLFFDNIRGALGVRHTSSRIPLFVPHRVVSQRRFNAPEYREIDGGKPIHIEAERTQAIQRRVSQAAPGAALLWYSGGSAQTVRGAIMAYVPVGDMCFPWYTGWAKREDWELVQPKNINAQELANLTQ